MNRLFFTLLLLLPFTLRSADPEKAESPEEAAARIAKMEKIADFALLPPTLNTDPLPEYDYNQLDYGMTIGMERTPGGRLWACWVAGGDSPKAFFVLASSDDDGESWSSPRLVLDSHSKELPRDRSILVGNLWTDPKGRLWLIFDQSMDMFDGRAGVWTTLCENPDADNPEWSPPRRIWHGVTLNKPTVLTSGEWMLPISLDQRGGFGPFKGCFSKLDPLRGAHVFVSTDEGANWERRGMATFPNPDWHEHMIVERKDKSLWMLARTAKGIMESSSTDRGKNWSEPIASEIKHPVARFHIRRLLSGRLLLVKHGDRIETHTGRVQLSAWLSDDDGKTWQGGLVLDERKGISYPDGLQAPDGTIYISYDRNRSTDGEILMARFTEQDILAKKTVGPTSKLKMLISRPEKGFKDLWDGKSFTGWKQSGNWVIEEGAFYRKEKGGSLTYTTAPLPDDFELRFDWKVSKGCNSGVYYRPGQVEYQILDNVDSPYGENARQAAASIFFCMAPKKDATRPVGEWNTARIKCKGSVIEHWLNEERVLSFDYTDPKWAEYVKLLGIRGGDLTGRGGSLWLQDHGQDVWFKNLRLRTIPPDEKLTPDPDFRPMPVTGPALEKEQARVRRMLGQAKPKDPFQSLFNGKDLAGWDGDPALWKVENGVVIGTCTGPDQLQHNSFLIWRGGRVKDFELRATVRVVGDNNSGIQYRSRELPEAGRWAISGYQCDIHPAIEHTGMTYEEKGRGIFGLNGTRVALDRAGERILLGSHPPVKVDVSQWNEYTVIARGNHLVHKVNDKVTSESIDHHETGRALEGLLAIQLHRGNPNRVEIKDLRIKTVSGAPLLPFDPKKLPPEAKKIDRPRTRNPQGTGPVVPSKKSPARGPH